jgi:hypothetical protein
MTPMGWVLENSKLSIHTDFPDAPHAQTIAVNPAIEKHDPLGAELSLQSCSGQLNHSGCANGR